MLPIVLIAVLQIHSIYTEHVQIQAFNKDLKENIESGNNTKLNESPQYGNELVAYNQLLPYLYSKLPIPGSLINQLRKYNINKNMLNKIHSYNKLRRELHSKLIENEINGYKYNDILTKKLQNLFKSVNKEEKKNFLNLINYLKMFNFDNNKLYNTLNDGNDLLKLINNNKMKYLPLMNSEKTLPDIFINNKVNKEIGRKLNQYKISSNDLYKKLINRINPAVLEEINKKSLVFVSKKQAQIKDVDTNNPSDLLNERIHDLTSFNKKPRILPLNENLPKSYIGKVDDIKEIKNAQKKEIDGSLIKYIKELQLLNEIEKERDELVNMKIEDLINPKKNTDQQNKAALLETKPSNALLALYLVLSIPGLLSALPNKNKKLPYIRNTKENILENSHIEAGKLYNYLMNKNVEQSVKKIHDALKKEKLINQLGGLNINDLDDKKIASKNKKNTGEKNLMKLNYHPFGHQLSHELVHDDNYYDAPILPQYDMNTLQNEKAVKLNGHELYSALRSRNKLILNEPTVINQNKDAEENNVNYKVDGDQLFAYLKKTRNNYPKEKSSLENFDHKIDGKMLFNQLGQSKSNKGGWKEDTIHSNPEINGEHMIDGSVLYNLLKDKQTDNEKEDLLTKNKISNNAKNQIRGQDLFDLLDPSGQYMYKVSTGENKKKAKKLNMDKFYQKLYQEYMKDNTGILKSMGTKINQNKVVWNDQNVEIPNISALNMNENTKQNIKAENEKNDHESNEGKYKVQGRIIELNKHLDHYNLHSKNDILKSQNNYVRGKNSSENTKRSRRSIYYDDFDSFEYRERQATLDIVLNNILNQLKITSPHCNISQEISKFTFPNTMSLWINSITTPVVRKQNVRSTTDFMFSKDADIDVKLLADYYRNIMTTTPKSEKSTSMFKLADIEKPKIFNKELLLLRMHYLKKAVPLNYFCRDINSQVKKLIMRSPPNTICHSKNTSHKISSASPNEKDNCDILYTVQETQLYNETICFETFRPYSTFRSRSCKTNKSKETTCKPSNKTLILRKLRSKMLPDIDTYHADRRMVEANGTLVVQLSNNDKITGADYVDDLLALYPDDPDILHKKFNKEQLEKQLVSYNNIFKELSEETKRKYYITLDIFSRMDHMEQVKVGAKIVINNVKEVTPSNDEMKVLYDEFSHDITNDEYENDEK